MTGALAALVAVAWLDWHRGSPLARVLDALMAPPLVPEEPPGWAAYVQRKRAERKAAAVRLVPQRHPLWLAYIADVAFQERWWAARRSYYGARVGSMSEEFVVRRSGGYYILRDSSGWQAYLRLRSSP